jgi:spore coat protein CotH
MCAWRGRALLLAATLLVLPTSAVAQGADELFDDSVVKDVRITINSSDWTALKTNFTENTYYPCKLEIIGLTVNNVGIRSRGLGSRSGTKPGLRVDADRYSVDQTIAGQKSFVLDNLVQDRSMLKERVTMAFFRRLGLPAPREAHVRLFVNNEFVGVYAIVESIDKAFVGRTFGQDSHGGVENDGYLFEYDWTKEYRFEYLGTNLDEYKLFEPKTHESQSATQIWQPIEDMVQAMNQAPDSTFAGDMAQYLDLGLFSREIALENFIAEDDGILGYAGLNNFYFYRFEDTMRSQFLPWDKDNTFVSSEFPIMRNVNDNVLSRRTLNLPEHRNRYLDTLVEAAQSAEEPDPAAPAVDENGNPVARPGWLEREITREYNQIHSLALSDTFKPYSNQEFEDAYQQLLAFARNRSTYVRNEVNALRPSTSQ